MTVSAALRPGILALMCGLFMPYLSAATAEDEVLKPIAAMLDGMAKRDSIAMKAPLLPEGNMIQMRKGEPVRMSFEAFAEKIAKPGDTRIEERIHDPLVRIDHDLAVVWASFDFLVDGKVNHCGTDLFTLVRQNRRWLIASIADTSRDNCTQ